MKFGRGMAVLSLLLTVVLSASSFAQDGGKVAVLYFTDHSGFDSGGGCLSIWPLSVIFGTGQQREEWELKSGFRDMLNQRLAEIGYDVIEPGGIDEIIEKTGTSDMAALASRLDADLIITGDIRKFEQHRTRASSQGPTTINSGEGMRLAAMGGIGGFYYSSTIRTNITIYDNTGDEVESGEVNSKKNLRDFYMGVGLMTYHRGDTEESPEDGEFKNPIVDYRRLDKMKFGSDEFRNRTLFGMATMDVMNQIADKVGEYLKPPELAVADGKILYIGTGERLKENEIYINLGAGDGMKPGHRLGVFVKAVELFDPDTGEKLGAVPEKKVGAIKILKVEADHLSLAEIIEGTDDIQKGNIVKWE